jgi:hypothetical protein
VDFFARQEVSRRTSRVLVGVFLLAFVLVALATTIVVAAALRLYTENNSLFLGTESWSQWLGANGGLVIGVAVGAFGLMVAASAYRAAQLARGGGHVARSLGGTRVTGDGSDPLERRLVTPRHTHDALGALLERRRAQPPTGEKSRINRFAQRRFDAHT